MAEATIDELQIEISASSASAADNLEKLAQKLERLGNVIQPIAANNGLEKIAKQLNKLSAISQKISQLSGFEKIGQVVSELRKIEQLGNAQDISPFIRNLNKLPRIVAAISQMPSVDATKFRKLADALKPLQSVSSSGINSLMNALRKLPKVSQELSGVDFTRFSQQIEQISRAIEPLARQAERAGQGLTAIAQIMQSTSRQARQSASGRSPRSREGARTRYIEIRELRQADDFGNELQGRRYRGVYGLYPLHELYGHTRNGVQARQGEDNTYSQRHGAPDPPRQRRQRLHRLRLG